MLSLLTRYRPVVKFSSSNPTDAWNLNHSQHLIDFCFLWMFPNHHSFQDHGSVSIFTYNLPHQKMFDRDVVSNDFPGHQETNGQGMIIFFLPSCRPGRSPTSLETALDIQTPENLRRCVDPSKYAKKKHLLRRYYWMSRDVLG